MGGWLETLGTGHAVARQARHLASLQARLSACLPAPLRGQISVAGERGGDILLAAANGAAGHRARLSARSIAAQLREQGFQVRAIRVVIQPFRDDPAPPRPKRAVLSDEARRSWLELAHSLPDSPLATAVERLVRHHGRPDLEPDAAGNLVRRRG